ncbi:hypothetical protein CIRG_03214 [Coccidioides immitis RMSCC 2394]|uniref:Uncharacterized protein n=1 Tax=Coccidioides immitis RMSCC 2394 TaxID=404692 RepID=A0A0J7B167_COCIT|nr:hypothetical protein CIRG_03214 [Coccidioides immitis RMSCC 2394]
MAASMNKYAGASLGILATLSPYVDGPGGEIFRPVSYVTHRIHTEHVVEKIDAGKPPYPRFPSDPKDRDAITHTLWPLSDFLKYGSIKLTIDSDKFPRRRLSNHQSIMRARGAIPIFLTMDTPKVPKTSSENESRRTSFPASGNSVNKGVQSFESSTIPGANGMISSFPQAPMGCDELRES